MRKSIISIALALGLLHVALWTPTLHAEDTVTPSATTETDNTTAKATDTASDAASKTSTPAQAATHFPEVVVTTSAPSDPLTVVTDPKAARQPIPAHDGSDYLKTIPGFSAIRKGGTDGDPVFRGMAGSRINILLDGENILGGCGGRMDPPTAYVFPESYDAVTILKGPQTVIYGPGSSAATVLFERKWKRFEDIGWRGNFSATYGRFNRNDLVADVTVGTPDVYARGAVTRTDANNYDDGKGREVHSEYTRWSANTALGWTPNENTRLEFSAARSDGEAAYRDRMMDGVEFERENYGLKFQTYNVTPWLEMIEAQVYHNYIDHVMDNYTMRKKPGASMYMVSNPDRQTNGSRLAFGLRAAEATQIVVGTDWQHNIHTLRTASSMAAHPSFHSLDRTEDANFRQFGVFSELTQHLTGMDRLIVGARMDNWKANDNRETIRVGMGTMPNPNADEVRRRNLYSGFGRWEHDFGAENSMFSLGLGHAERFPDFWEMINKESLATISAFYTKPEKTTQIDVGTVYQVLDSTRVSVSLFYNNINDFILIQSNVPKGMRMATVARNVDATTWGGEIGLVHDFTDHLQFDASLAYVRGRNKTDRTPLAQVPPLEGRLGLTWDNDIWSVGGLLRLVDEQNRFDVNKGNIAGQDLGHTPGFAVASLHAGYRPIERVLISVGVDNLFDQSYAEHISRSGTEMISGFDQTTRVNEPGRNFWARAQVKF